VAIVAPILNKYCVMGKILLQNWGLFWRLTLRPGRCLSRPLFLHLGGRMCIFDHLADVGYAEIGKDDALQNAVGNIKPQAEQAWQYQGDHDVNELHQDKGAKYIAKQSQGQRNRLDQKVQILKGRSIELDIRDAQKP
jgi:hypothetical protein